MENDIMLTTGVHSLFTDLENLSLEQQLKITEEPYSDANWCQLAFTLCSRFLEPYRDKNFDYTVRHLSRKFIPKGFITSEEFYKSDKSNKCLIFNTSYKFSGFVENVKEFVFHKYVQPLGGIRVFSIFLNKFTEENKVAFAVRNIIKKSIDTWYPGDVYIIAMHGPSEEWDIAYAKVDNNEDNIMRILNIYDVDAIMFSSNVFNRRLYNSNSLRFSFDFRITQ